MIEANKMSWLTWRGAARPKAPAGPRRIMLLWFAAALGLAPAAMAEPQTLLATPYGGVEVSPEEGNEDVLQIRVAGQTVYRFEAMVRVELHEFASDEKNAPSVFLVAEGASGGLACPFKYVVIELARQHAPRVSPQFGTCAEIDRATVRKDRLVMWMGIYLAHPELLSDKERRRAARNEMRYTWSKGRLTEAMVPAAGQR